MPTGRRRVSAQSGQRHRYVVTETPRGDLVVTVVDQGTSRGIPGAQVRLRGARQVRTNGSGEARFRLAPGTYAVQVSHRDFGPANPAAPQATISAGQTVSISVPMRSNLGELVVTVVDQETSRGLQNARVSIRGAAPTQTDASGIARFQLAAGQHGVQATHADFRPAGAAQVQATIVGGTSVALSVPMVVDGALEGKVVEDTPAAPAVPGATVTVTPQVPGSPATSRRDGQFRFGDLRVGTDYDLSAAKTGLADRGGGHARAQAVSRSAVSSHRVTLRLGALVVTPNQHDFVVVVDAAGAAPAAYPVLRLDISGGPPNHLFDVQVARGSAAGLTGGPGLAGAWNAAHTAAARQGETIFSSWSNGEQALQLDAAGAGNYTLPIEWWRDFARIPLSTFSSPIDLFCRVVTLPSAGAAISGDSGARLAGGGLKVRNNLISSEVVDHGYINGGVAKSVTMRFTVREANTTDMYTMVQWMHGSFRRWTGPGAPTYPNHVLYNITHQANFPDHTIDRLGTNPRYHDGAFTISADGKTASTTDAPSQGSIVAPFTHYSSQIDFETNVYLNFDVPAAVNVIRQDGSAPVYGVVTGNMTPDPLVLASKTWNTRVLQVRDALGNVTLTRPGNFAGP